MRDAERLSLDELRSLQHERLPRQLEYVVERSPFYRALWGETPPTELDELAQLPLSDKEMLRRDQAAAPPFGTYLAAEPAQVRRVHRTGGTTGSAMNIALSDADALLTEEVGARPQRAGGLGPGHRVIHCLNYQLWMGGYTDHAILEATGATVVPFGVGSTERLVATIRDLGITAISCTPSYPAVIEQVVDERFPGITPRDLGLELGLFGGEAGLDDLGLRGRLEETWGFAVRNSNYGVSDVLSNFAGQCEHDTDLHFFAGDVIAYELVDPEDDAPISWQTGATGEFVLTHLSKQCQPLVRFRTGDLITVTATEPCVCGRTTPRLRVRGRADDMLVVRGINVFPTAVAAVLNEIERLSGEYQIVLVGPPPHHVLPLKAEVADGVEATQDLVDTVSTALKHSLGITASVKLVAARGLPRTAGKTKRVLREGDSP